MLRNFMQAGEERTYADASKNNKIIVVRPNIKLKGSEITDCEILVVEGCMEASLNGRDIRIAEGGIFSGKAEVDVAEVRGTFEGELTARKRLVIYATGKVSGVIHYGAMMIEEGGTISGNLAMLADASLADAADLSAQTTASENASGRQTHFASTQNQASNVRPIRPN